LILKVILVIVGEETSKPLTGLPILSGTIGGRDENRTRVSTVKYSLIVDLTLHAHL